MNFLEKCWQAVNELIVDHWVKALFTGAFLLLTALWGGYGAWYSMWSRTFYRRFHFSLNVITKGLLKIRTLDEKDIAEVLLNNSAVANVLIRAAKKTTVANPFLQLHPDIRWLALNSALNELAHLIGAEGLLLQELGVDVYQSMYVIGLTCEKDPNVQTRKIRLMIIRKQLLEQMLEPDFKDPVFERSNHSTRLATLKAMAKLFREDPSQFMTFEVAIRK